MINEVRLIGNIGQEPEIRVISGGGKVANISVATSEKWKDKSGEWKEETQWHRISAFGYPADYIEKYVEKGMQVYVEGSIKYGSYEKNGQTVYTTTIKAGKIKILGKKGENSKGGNGGSQGGYEYRPDNSQSTGDDVPF